jgi:hypothetical protein
LTVVLHRNSKLFKNKNKFIMRFIMKVRFTTAFLITFSFLSGQLSAQQTKSDTTSKTKESKRFFIDVHQLEPGKVKFEDVAGAHAKDLATEKKYGVDFLKYWVDEEKGLVYCLSSSPDSASITKTHAEAHGLLPTRIYEVTDGKEAAFNNTKNLYLDIHYLGAGKVTAKDVAAAHEKDLAVEKKYGVNLINYWVNEKDGVVMCLAQAKDSTDLIKTHKEAHGLLPDQVFEVKQGQ